MRYGRIWSFAVRIISAPHKANEISALWPELVLSQESPGSWLAGGAGNRSGSGALRPGRTLVDPPSYASSQGFDLASLPGFSFVAPSDIAACRRPVAAGLPLAGLAGTTGDISCTVFRASGIVMIHRLPSPPSPSRRARSVQNAKVISGEQDVGKFWRAPEEGLSRRPKFVRSFRLASGRALRAVSRTEKNASTCYVADAVDTSVRDVETFYLNSPSANAFSATVSAVIDAT